MPASTPARFRDEHVVLAGVEGAHVSIPSASPSNYVAAIGGADSHAEAIEIDAKLFLPTAGELQPVVIVVPGSLGVGPNHRAHAATMIEAGFGALLIDPFGARSVESTIANQTPYSFAASAFDVLAALRWLRQHPLVDPERIHAQGHSRGGSAVLTAASRRFADPIVGADVGLAAVYAAYPWCGHQFLDPDVGRTRVRMILAERDEWCAVQQSQGHAHAIAAAGGDSTCRIVAGAAHSFDRLEDVHELIDASVSPNAPTIYLTDDGAMIDPRTGVADPQLVDRDGFVAAVQAGFGVKGASIGGVGNQPEQFRLDMIAFHTQQIVGGHAGFSVG